MLGIQCNSEKTIFGKLTRVLLKKPACFLFRPGFYLLGG